MTTQEVGIGGKGPDTNFHARRENFGSTIVLEPEPVRRLAQSVEVIPEGTGEVVRLWNINLGDLLAFIEVIITALGGGGEEHHVGLARELWPDGDSRSGAEQS